MHCSSYRSTRPQPVAGCFKITALILFFAPLYLVGCAIVHQKALEPLDWVDADIVSYPVSGAGSWARLRKQPLVVGPFVGELVAQSLWQSLPTTSTSDVQVSIGGDSGLRQGTVTQNNESELQVRLTGPSGALADLRCRQRLYIEDQEMAIGRDGGKEAISVSENVAYSASLACKAKRLSNGWPQWQLELGSDEPVPMHGILKVNGFDFAVVGSQASSIGQAPDTVSYEIRRGDHTLALIDRSGDGLVSLVMPVGERQFAAFAAAAVVLLLANDPLTSL